MNWKLPTLASLAAASLFFGEPHASKAAVGAPAKPVDPADVEFFEKSVRPLLEEHCVQCHSASKGKTKGGLALDSAAAVLKGGDTGPALVPGSPEKSLLIKAVSYADPELKMPPDDKQMPKADVAILQEWIHRGAYDPRAGRASGPDPEAVKKHWAFQPLRKLQPPAVRDAQWPRTETDRFVLAALEAKGIRPSPAAGKRELLRRVSYDLTGLPPTAEELDAFASNTAPEAYQKAVDRLLASPHFGERWGRYWLDVARYSDTKGLPAPINADRRFHFAYTYRDYVINAFNTDKPFNEFIIEQLAADLLPEPRRIQTLAALGYLTVGRCFQNNNNDIIDDRIDVVSRGLLGLTVTCARCHDHKFDPIPTADYYSLHGVFLSSEEPKERPIIAETKDTPGYVQYISKREVLLKKMLTVAEEEVAKTNIELVQKIPDYLVATVDAPSETDLKAVETFAGQNKLVGMPLSRWLKLLKSPESAPIFGPWTALAALPKNEFPAKAQQLCALWKTAPPQGWHSSVLAAVCEPVPVSLQEVAQRYGKLCANALEVNLSTEKAPPQLKVVIPSDTRDALRHMLAQNGAPSQLTLAEVEKVRGKKIQDLRTKVKDDVDVLDATDPSAPTRAMAIYDKPQPVQAVIFVRGNNANRGPNVPRQFLSALSGPERKPFTQGSGRLELAQAIASPSNPLTARVAVNRIWLHLFGRGLVGTPNDFGVRTASPAIPGVIDYLATRFIESGWSTKNVVRELVLSRTYQQASDARPDALVLDPNNDLLHCTHRRRLDFEALRDTLLQASSTLDLTPGGRAVELSKAPFSYRRSVYGYIDRQDLPSLFRIFDFANPDISTGQRFETTVPQQALFLMNNDFLKSLAESLAKLPAITSASAGPDRVQALFRQVLQRAARPEELEASLQLVSVFSGKTDKPWASLGQVLLLTNEVAFLD